jgi:hypothetical protein
VALLAAVFAGVVTAAAAGARRADSAYPRLLAWSKAPDMLIVSGYSLGFAPLPRPALARLPQVAAVGYVRGIALAASSGINLLAPEDNRIPGSFWNGKYCSFLMHPAVLELGPMASGLACPPMPLWSWPNRRAAAVFWTPHQHLVTECSSP